MRTIFLMVLMALAALSANTAMARSQFERGKAILVRDCGRCHAVAAGSTSQLANAPTFKDIAMRYPPENLAEALAEGIVTGHPDMPVASYEPAEIGAIIAYLEGLRAADSKAQ